MYTSCPGSWGSRSTTIARIPLTVPATSTRAVVAWQTAPRITHAKARQAVKTSNSSTALGYNEGMTASEHLQYLLSKDSDLTITCNYQGKDTGTVPGHSCVLKMWSGAFAEALEPDVASTTGSPAGPGSASFPRIGGSTGAVTVKSSETQPLEVSIHSVTEQEWLWVMQYVYPVLPQPKYNWHVVKTLLKVADAFEMPVILQRAGMFIEDHSHELTSSPSNEFFVWKWIFIADKYRLYAAAAACINSWKDVRELVKLCPLKELKELSGATLQQLVIRMAADAYDHK